MLTLELLVGTVTDVRQSLHRFESLKDPIFASPEFNRMLLLCFAVSFEYPSSTYRSLYVTLIHC
jgi:hypothetical protein